jgi:hypothetical protein
MDLKTDTGCRRKRRVGKGGASFERRDEVAVSDGGLVPWRGTISRPAGSEAYYVVPVGLTEEKWCFEGWLTLIPTVIRGS